MQLHVLEPLFTIFYTFVCKNIYKIFLPTKISRDKLQRLVQLHMENLRQASGQI